MAFITTIPVEQATGEVRPMYEQSQRPLGYVPHYAQLFSLRPQVYAAWGNLIGTIRSNLELRRYELVTLAAAQALRSSYCMLAHGNVLYQQFYSAEQVGLIVDDISHAELSELDKQIMAFVAQIISDAPSVTAEQIDDLRRAGLSDAEIFDIAATAAARCFFSTLLDALGAEPDAAYNQLEPALRQQLTVGRPISQHPIESHRCSDVEQE